jgi:hypothetical protein
MVSLFNHHLLGVKEASMEKTIPKKLNQRKKPQEK